MRSRFLPYVFVVMFAAVPLADAQRIAETVDVTVIEVPVTVSDKSGNAVRSLNAQNFEILVDGKRTPIEYFEAIDLTQVTAGSKQEQALPAAAYRNFLILFDVANSTPGTIGRAQAAAKQFVETQLNDRDLAAVATFTAEQGAQMVTSFTRDKEFLLGAIATLGDAKYFKVMDPLLLSAPQQFSDPNSAPEGKAAGARAEAQEVGGMDVAEFNTRANIANENEMRNRVRIQLRNFGGVARALDRLRGQKQVILLSEGFDPKLLTGRTDLSFQNTQQENDAVVSGEIWNVNTEQRFGSSTGTKDIQEMVDLFRRSDVRLHAIDIKGVRSNVDARDGLSKGSSNEALFMLTRPTGGTVFRNDNNLSAQFGQLLRRQEVIYLLGFKAKEGKPGTFHPVKVKLVGAKGEVAHRSGYYDTASNMSNLEATLKFSELMMTDTDVKDVPLSVFATPVPGSEGKARVPVVVDAVGAQLLQGITGNTANANIFIYAFDDRGEVLDYMQQRLSLDISKTGEAVRATGVRYVGSLRLPPGKYSLKALMRVDQTGRVGLTTTKIDVPVYGASAVLPPVSVTEMGQWLTLVSPARGADAREILTLGERAFVPHARAEVTRGSEHEIALMLRGIALDNLAVTPTLIAADGSSKPAALQLAGRTSPDAQGLVKLLFRFKPDVAPGHYDLRFNVTPSGGSQTVVSLPVVVQ